MAAVSSDDAPGDPAGATVPGGRLIRIVVVEDHALVREGTVERLEREADLSVVGEAGSGEEGLELVRTLQPDVALVDVELPGMNGISLAQSASEIAPGLRVLIVTAYDDYAYAIAALEAGVAGYLLKTASGQALADAVRTVASGSLVVDEAISRRLLKHLRTGSAGSLGGPRREGVQLTHREADVLRLLALGRANKQIAVELGLGLRTVESHVSNLIAKFGVTSRTEVALLAVSSDEIELEEPPGSP